MRKNGGHAFSFPITHHSSLQRRVLKMFCPRCAAQNLEDAKFCRSCGANISLVPQAVSGDLAERLAAEDESVQSRAQSRHERRRMRREERHDGKPVNIERAVRSFFM